MYNFIKSCINGDALLEDIDNYIDDWHDSESDLELHEFLGMDQEEYTIWVKDPDILPIIIKAHRENKNSIELMNFQVKSIAARSENVEKSEKLKQWLVIEGLWEEEEE